MAQPTVADAELILKLYEARRESELRKARQWWIATFWPESAEDIAKIVRAMGSQENAWLRQVLGYWSMAASFVTHGVLNEDLFYEPSFSGEMFLIYAKVEPFLKELREKLQNPGLLANLEKLIQTEKGQERYKITARNIENMRKARAENLARAS